MVDTQRKYSSSSSYTLDIQQLISLALNIHMDEITPDLAFGDLPQWDSMGHMEIMLLLEEKYAIEVNADTITALTNIPTICSYLKEHNHA
jgi:acyl carrier protein